MAITKVLNMDGLTYYNTKLNAQIAEKYVAKDGDKVLSTKDFTAEDKSKLDSLSNYELPTASADMKGGVKVGSGLKITEEVLSAEAQSWNTLTDKPSTFAPDTHTHTSSEITDLDATISAKIAGSTHLTRQIVEALPETEDAKENVVYMKKKEAEEEGNAYEEYLYIAETSKFELIGSSEVDLSGYVKTTDLQAITNDEIDALFTD